MGKRGWIIFTVTVLVLLTALVFFTSSDKVDLSKIDSTRFIAASADNGQIGDHIEGNKDAKVIAVEYGDYQCPYCAEFNPMMQQVAEKYKDQVGFIYRTFLLNFPHSRASAASAQAAGLQGHFWEMHSLIFEKQKEWSSLSATQRTDYFINLAKQAGVKDIEKFREDLSSPEVKKKIAFDTKVGRDLDKITGTPVLFINGQKIPNEAYDSIEKLSKYFDDALKKAGVELPKSADSKS